MSAIYDYIIVGAGSAGCVLADRLSASGKYRVLVLEAGGSDNRFWIQTPIGYGRSFFDPAVNWMYMTEADPGTGNRASYWPRGKVLGGSSSINAMVFVRGQQRDFEDWKSMGNTGWGWDDVLPYFKKMETNATGGNEFRGDSGPLYVNTVSEQYHPLCHRFIEASKEMGFEFNEDFNGASQEGVGFYQITTRGGRRMSTCRAYLKEARKRRNCEVKTGAHTTAITVRDGKAVGVRYQSQGRHYEATAGREVILSAGAVNSPQILQLSGIGPGQLLQNFGLEVIRDLPAVGENLQDHLTMSHYYKSRVPTLNDQLSPWWGKLKAGLRYLTFRDGVLSLSVNQAGGFVRSNENRQHPNLQLYFAALTYTKPTPGERRLMSPDRESGFLNGFSQLRPTSRGSLALQSADPFAAPSIRPNYLSTDADVTEMLEGCRLLRAMARTPTLSALIKEEYIPGPAVTTDEQLLEDIRLRSETVYHPTSTCMMGRDDRNSVVDAECRVHGVDNLRVVDASVFPTVTSGNTNAPTIMVAEKASDMILQAAR